MSSARETGLSAIHAALLTLAGPVVERDLLEPVVLPAGGLLVLVDGESEIAKRGQSTTICQHTPEVLVAVPGATAETRADTYDALLLKLDALFAADPTFGGALREFQWFPPKSVQVPSLTVSAKAGMIRLRFVTIASTPLQ